ncbi:hypothetical protein AJ80_00293 [Polytolypa hystricis UAMH7299]|uniref:Kinesin motor domain-containing protein n=1 Tax=Polytolypa hystricis (strain UAMH7299) TaxID=1447883 RepID=A0A2B7Z4I9_POLH7|nr:hypothetical protein AJ80_00293 [Polytolypa hystricis UAMH7299]
MAGPTRSQAAPSVRRALPRAAPKTRVSALAGAARSESPANFARPSAASAARSLRSPSVVSNVGTKRKEREFDPQEGVVGQSNIHVVVRCRGRNDREVKENSGVVVSTEGVRGKSVELSMGPNAMGNKEYHFDKVFSPAADQAMIYEDVVIPILNDMLSGFNCTIFAYGQTGTGKTYTMSGDMNDALGLLSDAAGIIPRVLYSLFKKLEDFESTVKCSFIELYNEDLRDLLSSEDGTKLKLYEDSAKKGFTSTMVQGMGETYINSASAGIKLLRQGSHRRQVASTKCNDLSSRSHTVFTITAFIKRKTEKGEEYVSSGKLNLVDLAGSENIQRSGAENKRATEAGLINKSLLTLGRVINALVDASGHIPYRESKLTRLLQDSLGGQTKTCIIATISPSRSNIEETISTLDYAFRAKNIRNKPQINSTISKKTLLREFTTEIEKLRSELIATRSRNGVYLPGDAYEEMTIESESRRILTEEQRAKIETMEANLKNKVQELFTLTSNFKNLKKDNDETRQTLEETEDLLEKTDLVLKNAQRSLDEEEMLRKAHETTEQELHGIGTGLISTVDKSVADVSGLHAKLRRRSDLHSLNREIWQSSTAHAVDVTRLVDERVNLFQSEQSELLANLSSRMESFIEEEKERIESGLAALTQSNTSLGRLDTEARSLVSSNRDEMNDVLEEIKTLREDVKEKVGEGLQGLSTAAARISNEVIDELEKFQVDLRTTYTSLGDELKGLFRILAEDLRSQKEEAQRLRKELHEANKQAVKASEDATLDLETAITEEKETVKAERTQLMTQIKALLDEAGEKQATRFKRKIDGIRGDMKESHTSLRDADVIYGESMDTWEHREDDIVEKVSKSEETLKRRMEEDWDAFDSQNAAIQESTRAVHRETVDIVNEQMDDIATQMQDLDDFVTRARSHNDRHHDSHMEALDNLTTDVRSTHSGIRDNLNELQSQVADFEEDISYQNDVLNEPVEQLTANVRKPLAELQSNIQSTTMTEYAATGETPQKTVYEYTSKLPRTEPHDNLLAKFRGESEPSTGPLTECELNPTRTPRKLLSPTKTTVYQDADNEVGSLHNPPPAVDVHVKPTPSSSLGLREVDINVAVRPLSLSGSNSSNASNVIANTVSTIPESSPLISKTGMAKFADTDAPDNDGLDAQPPAKKRCVSTSAIPTGESKLPHKPGVVRRRPTGLGIGVIGEGPENAPISSMPVPSATARVRRLRSNNM